jgi:hypothetical protein
MVATAADVITTWPDESKEVAQLVVDTYGEPHEMTESRLTWHKVGPWKRIVATKTYYEHAFPTQHIDSVESFIDCQVPSDRISAIADFDGTVIVERTAGEVSARCHDEQANFLALNLAHDIITGARTVQEAREYYGKEFLDARRKKPTPYMERLCFDAPAGGTADPDVPIILDEELERAAKEGESGLRPSSAS